MQEKELITIIVPVYNGEKHIARCLDSLFAQIYSCYEVLVIDDGSIDETATVLEMYQKKYENLRVIRTSHKGVSHARNTGLQNALGNLIAYVDSDDEIFPEYLEVLYQLLIMHQASVSVCGLQHVRTEESALPLKESDVCDLGNYEVMNPTDFLKRMEEPFRYELTTICCNKLYKKCLFTELKFPEGKIYEDSAMLQDVISRASVLVETDRKLYLYHRETIGITRSAYTKQKLDEVEHSKQRMLFFEEKNEQELYVLAKKQYCLMLLKHYYLMKKYEADCKAEIEELRSAQKNFLKGWQWKKALPFKVATVFEFGRFCPYLCGWIIVKWDAHLEKYR